MSEERNDREACIDGVLFSETGEWERFQSAVFDRAFNVD